VPGIEGELGGVLEGGEEVCVKEAIPSIVAGIVGCHDPSAPRPGALKDARRKKPGRSGRDDGRGRRDGLG